MRCSRTVAAKIGVLALQGDVSEHIAAFARALRERGDADARVRPVRRAAEIGGLDGLAIPGGESTTISRLIDKNGMRGPLVAFEGGIFATCAGMVLMASEIDDPRVTPLGLMEMTVERNAFGRQKESFEAEIEVRGLDRPFHAVFIRAPVVTRHGADAVALGRIERGIVALQQGRHMAFSFHPELGGDLRLHRLFLDQLGC
jgi:5'-phosphate synthase pdxT subunit